MNHNLHIPTLEDIKAAHQRIQPFIHKTPIMTSGAIDKIAGCQVYFKCENFQKVGAFKARGAANAVMKLTENQKKRNIFLKLLFVLLVSIANPSFQSLFKI